MASWDLVSSEAVSCSSSVKVRGWVIIFALLIAVVMSATANSTAETQSLLALGPVRGNIAPILTSIGGVVGVLLSLPQPPRATGTSNDNAAPSMVTFCENLVVGWLMPCQIGSARDLLERRRITVPQSGAESARAGAGAHPQVSPHPALRFRTAAATNL